MSEPLYSEIILAKIKVLKKQIRLTKKETEKAFYDSLTPQVLFSNKYFYIFSGSLVGFLFRKRIPRFVKTLIKLFFARYPVKRLFKKG